MGAGFRQEWVHVYVWLSPFAQPETITTLLTQNKKFEKREKPLNCRISSPVLLGSQSAPPTCRTPGPSDPCTMRVSLLGQGVTEIHEAVYY